MLDQRVDHLLAPLAQNQFAFGLLVSHLKNPLEESLDQFRKAVKAAPKSTQVE